MVLFHPLISISCNLSLNFVKLLFSHSHEDICDIDIAQIFQESLIIAEEVQKHGRSKRCDKNK